MQRQGPRPRCRDRQEGLRNVAAGAERKSLEPVRRDPDGQHHRPRGARGESRPACSPASGVAAAIAATEANEARARALGLSLVTPAKEAVVGRRLTFVVERTDPVWGAGVQIGVDFGDGSPPFIATAEQLRQGRTITHEYVAPLTTHLSVVAAKDLKPGGIEPVNAALGEGGTALLIAPSPVSRAQRMADDFLNLRFADRAADRSRSPLLAISQQDNDFRCKKHRLRRSLRARLRRKRGSRDLARSNGEAFTR